MATVLLEVAYSRKCYHPVIFLLIGLLCVGFPQNPGPGPTSPKFITWHGHGLY